MIQKKVFNHGWYYNYCVHKLKTETLAKNFPSLQNYLLAMFSNCPNQYFFTGPRSSRLRFSLGDLGIEHCPNHPICKLTKYALEVNAERFKEDHLKVQMFMLENDNNTIAIEVPLWILPEEFEDFGSKLGNEPLTGHIDLLKIEDGKIWIWDYKPSAAKEKYAATQTYFYALMLSRRTGIPLENFMCGWFDTANCYAFKPKRKCLADF